MKRPRLLRAASATGAVICGVLAVLSTSALAGGEFTTATLLSPASDESSATFTWSYQFHQNDGHGLSNLAIGFCDEDVLDHIESASQAYTVLTHGQGGHDGFDGIKFDAPEVTGEISVTFDQEYAVDPEGLLLQSHSGDGEEGDEVRTAPGPGPCPTETTEPTIVVNQEPTTTTTAAPTTTTATTAPPAVGPQTLVLGETLTAPVQAAELPRTGTDGLITLTLAGLALILAGLACVGAPRLRRSH